MSVPEGLRKCGKLKVLIEALDLTDYTLEITRNTKVFKPEYKEILTDDIIKLTKRMYINLFRANRIIVNGKADAERRLSLQVQSLEDCEDLLSLIQIAQKTFHLKLKRIKFWGSKICSVKSLINSWHTAEIERYSACQF